MRRVALIHNPDSGSAGEHGSLADLLAGTGIEVTELPIERADEATEAGVERILVAGGDGTIAPAAAAAVAAGVPLAVIPLGTANDFAQRMGLPADVAAAAALAVRGIRCRRVDLGLAGSMPFLNAASAGLASSAAEAAAELKERFGALAYTIGALEAGATSDPVGCRVACDGEVIHDGDAWQVTVGCTGAFGGGSGIAADADDRMLDVVVIEHGPRARLAKHAIGLRTGGLEQQVGVCHRRCKGVEVAWRDSAELNVDGELLAVADLGSAKRTRFGIESSQLELVIG